MKAHVLLGAVALLLSSNAQACLLQESESNNTEATADSGVCSNQQVTGAIGSTSDVDWYSFDTTSTGNITVKLSHGSNTDFDFYLYLHF